MSIHKTPLYDVYWQFATERQNIFFKRMNGEIEPWTNDPILKEYKFTNAYRVEDRVSQFLIKNVIYSRQKYSEEDMLFRILLFKIFNKIETWQSLENNLGEITYTHYNRSQYEKVFDGLLQDRMKLYSAAYIMPSGKTSFGYSQKYKNNLSLIELMMKDHLMCKISVAKNLEELYETLLLYPSLGKFLAFQYAIDINYSELCDFDEMSFVIAGPGAKNGIEKCFGSIDHNYEYYIKYMADRQNNEFSRLNLMFKGLYGRKLQLIDCQNLFCEIDKYARAAFPNIICKTNRTRIKQKFRPKNEKIDYYFPPKWGLNITEDK